MPSLAGSWKGVTMFRGHCSFGNDHATEVASSQGLCAAASRGRSGSASAVPPPPPRAILGRQRVAGAKSRDAHMWGSEKEAHRALLDGVRGDVFLGRQMATAAVAWGAAAALDRKEWRRLLVWPQTGGGGVFPAATQQPPGRPLPPAGHIPGSGLRRVPTASSP